MNPIKLTARIPSAPALRQSPQSPSPAMLKRQATSENVQAEQRRRKFYSRVVLGDQRLGNNDVLTCLFDGRDELVGGRG